MSVRKFCKAYLRGGAGSRGVTGFSKVNALASCVTVDLLHCAAEGVDARLRCGNTFAFEGTECLLH